MKTAQLNPGRTGAKRQSWSTANPRDVLRDVARRNPRASEAEVRDSVWAEIEGNEHYLSVIFDYWFTNTYRCFFVDELCKAPIVKIKKPVARASSGPITREEIEIEKERLRPILMDHVLSSGKLIRDATFKELGEESGWLRELSKCGKPTEVVGKHLTEKNLWDIRKRVMD